MRKIDLDELYGGAWQWVEEDSLCGIKYRGADLDVKPLREHLEYWSKVPTYPSLAECGRNGYDIANVSKACQGVYKQHKGYKWSYTPL